METGRAATKTLGFLSEPAAAGVQGHDYGSGVQGDQRSGLERLTSAKLRGDIHVLITDANKEQRQGDPLMAKTRDELFPWVALSRW